MNITINEEKLQASICKDSFFDFVKEFWEVVITEPPVWNWHIQKLCGQLQKISQRVFLGLPKKYDLIINVPPGTTKSTIVSVMYPAWNMANMPSCKHICGSHTDMLVQDLSRKSRDVVRSEKYQKYFPNVRISDDQDTKGYWLTTKNGLRLSCTVAGRSPTGFHAHFLIVDDPIDPQKALSEAELKGANNWMDETLPSRKVDKDISVQILVMQRLHQNDPAGHWLEQRRSGNARVKHICLPAELSENVKPKAWADHYVDGLLDPRRLSSKALDEFKGKGQYYYAGQFMQDPVPAGGGMFNTKKLHIMERHPLMAKFRRIYRYWDKAGTPTGKGAFTVGILMGVVHVDEKDQFWILDVIRERLESGAREKLILKTSIWDNPRVIIAIEQEPGSGGKESAEGTISRLSGRKVRVDIPKGDKVERADPFSVQVNWGNVYLVRAEWNHDYIEEMKYFPFSTFKDQIDASSGAFAMLTKKSVTVGAF